MTYNKENYIKEVMKELTTNKATRKRIIEDLEMRIEDGFNEDPYFDIEKELGTPSEIATEFAENLGSSADPYIKVGLTIGEKHYEYKSKTKVFGLPLVHIHTGGSRLNKAAKGIIAIGDISYGVISIGGVATGIFTFGGVSVGLVAFGGVAVGGLAFGGVAVGLFAAGGVAFGILKAIGALKYFL
ncbi:hypothetical protein CI105_05915 [Candidatus Izimaplasma bacterium ZiA1]|uniref:HAAS signaling domain-containing protein n=1 Tax=Candidatus Izimoplasma sp. ZiA1 TaxID=2024899 RepID=UPI000BAA44DE|nr:hypothetical protein CI105_05915 [Candidatus Izimaplasma bacterium ZiA1]